MPTDQESIANLSAVSPRPPLPPFDETTAPAKVRALDKEAQAATMKKAEELAPKYRPALLKPGPIEVIEKLFKQPNVPDVNVTFFVIGLDK